MAELEWKSIADFSPGIRDNPSGNNPPGSAQVDGTFGCYAIEGGSLGPLPRYTTIAPPMGSLPDFEDILDEQFRITGVHSRAPVFGGVNNIFGPDQVNDEIMVSVQYHTDIAGDESRYHGKLFRYRRNWATPQWNELWSRTRDIAWTLADSYDGAFFTTVRSNSANPVQLGPATTVFCDGGGTIFCTPPDTAPGTDAVDYLPGDYATDSQFSSLGLIGAVRVHHHQGRIVTMPLYVGNIGTQSVWVSNEQFFWSQVNNVTARSDLLDGPFNYTPSYNEPFGYHVVASLTADELFLVKSSGGAAVVRGDLDDGTVINYPYVRSTGFTRNNGTPTPVGYMYPVDGSGVWLWTGGQVAENLTSFLPDDFWRPPLETVAGEPVGFQMFPTSCAQWGDWAVFPNNWLCDTDALMGGSSSAWWRLLAPDDEHIIHNWNVNYRGTVAWGCPGGFQSAADPIILEFDRTGPGRNSYQWRSHPLNESLEREATLREVVIVASGPGAVEVTATTAEDTSGTTVSFPVDGTPSAPQFIRQSLPVAGTQITFTVTATATDPDDPAPTIHEIRYGVVPNNGNLITNQ